MSKKKKNTPTTTSITLSDIAAVQKTHKEDNLLDKLVSDLGENPAQVALMLLKNPQLSELEAYQTVYECTDDSAYKNFRRVTRTPEFIQALSLMHQDMDNLVPTKEALLELLWQRGKTSIKDVADWDKNGLHLKEPKKISPVQAQMIKNLKIKRHGWSDEEGNKHFEEQIQIAMHDQFSSLKLLADYLGITKTVEDPKTQRINTLILAIQQKIGIKEL